MKQWPPEFFKCMIMQVGLGEFLHQLDDKMPNSPVPIDDVLAAVLLIFFGVQTLRVSSLPGSAPLQTSGNCAVWKCWICQAADSCAWSTKGLNQLLMTWNPLCRLAGLLLHAFASNCAAIVPYACWMASHSIIEIGIRG